MWLIVENGFQLWFENNIQFAFLLAVLFVVTIVFSEFTGNIKNIFQTNVIQSKLLQKSVKIVWNFNFKHP